MKLTMSSAQCICGKGYQVHKLTFFKKNWATLQGFIQGAEKGAPNKSSPPISYTLLVKVAKPIWFPHTSPLPVRYMYVSLLCKSPPAWNPDLFIISLIAINNNVLKDRGIASNKAKDALASLIVSQLHQPSVRLWDWVSKLVYLATCSISGQQVPVLLDCPRHPCASDVRLSMFSCMLCEHSPSWGPPSN